ncbi:MAG: helix-turn-helix transcriptional regulator [Enterocloster asparagiformis]|nr:helix-turn-helix transcriptional regulator [Enterocloster asparagiformis]
MIAKNIRFSEDNQELIKPILPGLPISVFFTAFREDTYSCINWHWHEAFQYCLVTEGSVDFLLPNCNYCVKAGNGIFINTQQVHFSKSRGASPSSYLCLDIPPAFIYPDERSRLYQKYIQPVLRNPYPQVLLFSRRDTAGQQLLQSIRNIRDLLKEEPEFMELDIHTEIINIWKTTFRLLVKTGPPPVDYNDNDRLKLVLQYMLDHYSEKITLEDIAGQLSISSSECCRFFKKATGQSLFSYLKNLRINKSMDMLKDPKMSISEIADAVGFCNQSYYTDCFRKVKNITPKKYRELTLRNPNDILPLDINST